MDSAPQTARKFRKYKPQAGSPVNFNSGVVQQGGIVSRVEGSLCWVKRGENEEADLFIWCFRDGLNALWSWPEKDESKSCVIKTNGGNDAYGSHR